MTELEKIQEAFHDNCHFHDKILIERFADNTSMSRRICDGGYNYFIVRLETQNNKAWYPYFKTGHGLNSICDFIIFVESSEEIFVLLVEMKLGSESPQRQLDYSENFVKFVLRRMMLTNKLTLGKPVFIRKLGLTNTKPPKHPTKMNGATSPSYDDNNYIKRYKDTKFNIRLSLLWPTKDKKRGLVNLFD